MNRKVQHLLTASASVLAIGAGAVVAQAAGQGTVETVTGGTAGQWSRNYVLTDVDTTTADILDTKETGVVGAALADVINRPTGMMAFVGQLTGVAAPTVTNGGTFTVKAGAVHAPATGNATAAATINVPAAGPVTVNGAFVQDYLAAGNLNVVLANTGKLGVVADASATSVAVADASATVDTGIVQNGVEGDVGSTVAKGDVTVALNNNAGSLTVGSQAVAAGATGGTAASTLTNGIIQTATNDGIAVLASGSIAGYSPSATVALANAKGATINVGSVGTATASTSGPATATVELVNGIVQTAEATDTGTIAGTVTTANVGLNNAGTLNIGAVATATSAAGAADASVNLTRIQTAIAQTATARNASATFTNTADGVVNLVNSAAASGQTTADATSWLDHGIEQTVTATGAGTAADPTGVANLTFTNAGKLNLSSTAKAAAGAGTADAFAYVSGIVQEGTGKSGTLAFSNTGSLTVTGVADANSGAASSPVSTAEATAQGLYVGADGPAIKTENGGTFTVLADAKGQTGADAFAGGIKVEGTGVTTPASVTNSGTLTVTAKAIDTNATASVAGVGTAEALGIWATGAIPNGTITNSGTIAVTALTNYADLSVAGAGPVATGILVDSLVASSTPATDKFTVNNNAGAIIAATSNNNGTTYQWGTAIDTVNAGSVPVAINLNGAAGKAGQIYGNINIGADDVITVANGETQLNGIVNSSASPTVAGVGTLNIVKGGTLFLRDTPEGAKVAGVALPGDNGPSKVYVEDFSVTNGGVLAIEAPNFRTQNLAGVGNSTNIVYGEYPQVYATNADVTGGILEIRPASTVSDNGLYSNSFVLDDVIVADDITGTLAGVKTRSVLLSATARQDSLEGPAQAAGRETIDVAVKRVAFNAVAGLDRNETSVATALEGTYTPNQSTAAGTYGSVLADLFKIDDAVVYASALEQLAATQYAGYLRSSTMAGARFNSLIYDMAECGKGSITNELCRSENGGPRLWITGNYGRVSTDGDNEAAGFKANQYWIAAGLDFAVSPNFVLGVAGGYLENSNKFKANEYDYKGGDSIKSKGWQAGIYGNYDSGKFYVKGAVSYSDLDGNSRRNLNLTGMGANYVNAPQTVTGGLITGDADVNVWAAGAEAGVRFPLGENATITPYASLDYAHAKMKRFNEKTSDLSAQGALLSVRGSDEFFASELGLELAAQWGNVSPYIRGGWQHNFGDKRAKFTGDFIGAPAGTSFDVVSERFAPDAGVVEVGLAAQFSPNFNAHLGYQGRFSKNVEEHTGGLTLSYLFGGAEPVAPPPPPAPVTPPPPPPPPPQVVCNKGPYIVFFDFDKSDITPEAATVLDSAVTAYGNCDVVPIMLAGYTDRAGTPRYNMGLSARRNTSVQGYLTSRGIPGDRISAQAFGEANPRVPTADGVRELQNRRVEITYGPGSGN